MEPVAPKTSFSFEPPEENEKIISPLKVNYASLDSIGDKFDKFAPSSELIAEAKRFETQDNEAMYHRGFIYGLIFDQCPSKTIEGFANHLQENGLTVPVKTALNNMKVYATFQKFPPRVREQVQGLGFAKAVMICDYITLNNTNEIIGLARATRADLLVTQLQNYGKIGTRPSYVPPLPPVVSLREKEMKRKRQQYYGMMALLNANQEGDLIGSTIFIPRSKYLSQREEVYCMLVYNMARGNLSMDDFFIELMSKLYDKLTPEQQNEVEKVLAPMNNDKGTQLRQA